MPAQGGMNAPGASYAPHDFPPPPSGGPPQPGAPGYNAYGANPYSPRGPENVSATPPTFGNPFSSQNAYTSNVRSVSDGT